MSTDELVRIKQLIIDTEQSHRVYNDTNALNSLKLMKTMYAMSSMQWQLTSHRRAAAASKTTDIRQLQMKYG